MKLRVDLHRNATGCAVLVAALALGAQGCSSSGSHAPVDPSLLRIATVSGGPLQTVAGDALALKVVQTTAEGATSPLPSDVNVTWTSPAIVAALPPDDDGDPDPVPDFGAQATGIFIKNSSRSDRQANLAGVLFVLDPGTGSDGSVQVTAAVSGAGTAEGGGELSATIAVSAGLAGDATHGAAVYRENCAECHGVSGQGSVEPAGSISFAIGGKNYDFPAPGLNTEPGNLAEDPTWNAALLAVASRSDMDNAGIALRSPMPDWLATPASSTGAPLSTQDFADIYAFLQKQ